MARENGACVILMFPFAVMTDDNDVPSPIDFSDSEQARQWVEDATIKRPWRPDFFQAFANEIRTHAPLGGHPKPANEGQLKTGQ